MDGVTLLRYWKQSPKKVRKQQADIWTKQFKQREHLIPKPEMFEEQPGASVAGRASTGNGRR